MTYQDSPWPGTSTSAITWIPERVTWQQLWISHYNKPNQQGMLDCLISSEVSWTCDYSHKEPVRLKLIFKILTENEVGDDQNISNILQYILCNSKSQHTSTLCEAFHHVLIDMNQMERNNNQRISI